MRIQADPDPQHWKLIFQYGKILCMENLHWLIVILEPVPLLPEGAVAGVVVRADEALIGCNQMLNVFLLAGCTCRWSSDWFQSKVKRVPIGWRFKCMAGVIVRADKALIGCNQMLNVFLLAGCTCRWSSDWFQSNVKRVPIDWRFKCMAGVIVRADKALIGCNQMLNVFLLASRNQILHEFLMVTNERIVLYV